MLLAALLIALVALTGSAVGAPALRPRGSHGPGDHSAPYVLRLGETAAVYSYADAIRESVWVEAPDGDENGEKDLVTADIIRPRELEGVATVPVIMDASPYYLCCGRGNESE